MNPSFQAILGDWLAEIARYADQSSALALGAFDLAGRPLYCNDGMRRLSGRQGADWSVADCLILPLFETLASAPAGDNNPIFQGWLTLEGQGLPARSAHGAVWRRGDRLLILAESDVNELDRAIDEIAALNDERTNLQRDLTRLKAVLETQKRELIALSEHFALELTEREQAEIALKRHATRLALINQIARQVAEMLDLQSVLNRAATLIQQSFGYPHVGLFLVDDARQEIVMRAKAGSYAALFRPDHRLGWGRGIVGWVAQQGEMLLANDVRHEPRYRNPFSEQIIHSELSVPIRIGGLVVGVLDVQCQDVNAFDDNDLMVMATLADQLAVAIRNAELYEAESQQRALAEALSDTAALVNSTLDRNEALDRILAHIERVVPHDAADVMLIEEGTARSVRCRGYAELGSEEAVLATSFLVAETPNMAAVLNRGTPHVIPDTADYPGWIIKPSSNWIRSHISAPIRVANRTFGLLNVESATPGFYSQAHADRLQAFADQVAIALHNTQLYGQINRYAEFLEQRVDERTAELRQEKERAEELSALKSRFIETASHEFRTPLALIQSSSDMLKTYFEQLSPAKRQEKLDRIEEGIRRMVELLENVLAVTQTDSDKANLVLAPLDLDAFCQDLLPKLAAKTGMGDRIVFLNTASCAEVVVDQSLVRVIIESLVSNALKFSPSDTRVIVELTCDPQQIVFRVQDRGMGIPAADQYLIFEAFQRAGNIGALPGSGLGLTLVKRATQALGGAIRFESAEGQGTTFWVTIPTGALES